MSAHRNEAPPVEVRGLTSTYRNGTQANRDIAPCGVGSCSAFGPNGAGKTTLVRQITTELVPTSGEVRVFGIDAVAHPNRVKTADGRDAAGGQPLLSTVGTAPPAHLREAAGPAASGRRPAAPRS